MHILYSTRKKMKKQIKENGKKPGEKTDLLLSFSTTVGLNLFSMKVPHRRPLPFATHRK